jgi:hypothetical protein
MTTIAADVLFLHTRSKILDSALNSPSLGRLLDHLKSTESFTLKKLR